jgi:Flp pilus assembly pilin Flp
MIMQRTTSAQRTAARLQVTAADVGARIDEIALRYLGAWRDDGERGAQAAEYAMLGGVSAAACSALVAIFKNRSTLQTLVESIVKTLGTVIEGWF